MVGLPLRTLNRQQAYEDHQLGEGPCGQEVLWASLPLQQDSAPSNSAPADLATPGHKVPHSLGRQSEETQPLRNSHKPPRREKQIGT